MQGMCVRLAFITDTIIEFIIIAAGDPGLVWRRWLNETSSPTFNIMSLVFFILLASFHFSLIWREVDEGRALRTLMGTGTN